MALAIGAEHVLNKQINYTRHQPLNFRVSLATGVLRIANKVFGILQPTIESIAIAIAKRDKARIIPTGVNALNKLGPSFVGVTQLPVTVSDQEIIQLNEAGVRAA